MLSEAHGAQISLRPHVAETTAGTSVGAKWRQFTGSHGEREYCFIVKPEVEGSFDEQLSALRTHYENALAETGLPLASAIFARVFLSDAINQSPRLRATPIVDGHAELTALSVIGQSPVGGPKLAMLAYHVAGPSRVTKRRLSGNHLLVERAGARHLWSTRLCAHADDQRGDVGEQTRGIFADLVGQLSGLGATLKDNCVRTWLYIKDVDVFYRDMVRARRELFDAQGLSADTHYIASTGIEGACSHAFDLVSMDAYSNLDLRPGQMSYLNDFSRLCPTKKYGVTFERATRVAYADRAHAFISGTAAIDSDGQVMHRGDVMRQLERALGNVEALLRDGDASLDDMMYLLVYLRDPSDYSAVSRYLARRFPTLPILIVQGAVCRPDWLIEVEGQAIAPFADASLPRF